MTFQDSPTNWDRHFDDLMKRALKRMHILRVCIRNGYTVVYLILITSLIDLVTDFEAILTSRQGNFGAVTKHHTNLKSRARLIGNSQRFFRTSSH